MPFPSAGRKLTRPLRARLLPAIGVMIAAVAALAATSVPGAARAATLLPVSYDFITAATTNTDPTTPPPGANNWSCKPSAEHPYPVVLVHGTAANMDDDMQAESPTLVNHCTAAGSYGSASGPTSAASVFVVAEQNGTWSTATTVPGATSADALSCPSAGNCVLGGIVATTGTDTSSAYLAVETNGTWDAPKTIPSRTGQAYTAVPVDIDAISCTAAGDCTVTGQALNATQQNFANGGGSYAPLVATMTNGVLGSVTELSLPSFQAPGDSNSDEGWITSLSCASAGTCTAVGIDEQQAPDAQNPPTVSIFAASEVNRTWSTPALLPGSAARNVSNTATGQLSCASASSPRPGGV